MKMKKAIFKTINSLFISCLLTCKLWDWPKTTDLRNPDLIFLAGDTLSTSIYCVEPVVSPDGETIYYIKGGGVYGGRWYWGDLTYEPASIYAIDSDGKNERLILKGKYRTLAISPDGKKLAFTPGDSLILILNLINQKIDSFKVITKWVEDIEFSYDTNWVYYSGSNRAGDSKLFRLNLSDSTNEQVFASSVFGFDIFKNGEIYVDLQLPFPQINPTNERYVISPSGGEFAPNAVMRDLLNNSLIYFEDNAFKPHCVPILGCCDFVGGIYWFPDGNTVVFSASRCTDPGGVSPQLWILKNVFKHIKK